MPGFQDNEFSSQLTSTTENFDQSIKRALNRKAISNAYHSTVPVFLKSQGPFAIYDHSLKATSQVQSPDKFTVTDRAALEALKRYEGELKALKL